MAVYLDFSGLPRPEPPEELRLPCGPRGELPRWLVLGLTVWLLIAFATTLAQLPFAVSHKTWGSLIGTAGVVSLGFVLLLLVPFTLEWIRLRRVLASLRRPYFEDDVAKLETALRRQWASPARVILLGLLGTIRVGHGQLPMALATYGVTLSELGSGGSRKMREATALSVTHALAYAARCEDAEKWASTWEQAVTKRACMTVLARAVVAHHRRDFQRVLSLTKPISLTAGPPVAKAIKAYALAQTGADDEGRRLASSLQGARRAQLADICFASHELKRFLLECGVSTASVEAVGSAPLHSFGTD